MTNQPSTLQTLGESILGAFQVGGNLVLSPFLYQNNRRWGAEPHEVGMPLPGDELTPQTQMSSTHAITIQASPERIWQWIVQIGQGRGGLYSYDGLENLIGCNIHSRFEIVPELQNLKPGDLVRLGPKGYPCYQVEAVQPCQWLVLLAADPKTEQVSRWENRQPDKFSIGTWQFYLNPIQPNSTRLIVRQRLAYSPNMATIWKITEPISFVMERRMMLTIKRLVEKIQN